MNSFAKTFSDNDWLTIQREHLRYQIYFSRKRKDVKDVKDLF